MKNRHSYFTLFLIIFLVTSTLKNIKAGGIIGKWCNPECVQCCMRETGQILYDVGTVGSVPEFVARTVINNLDRLSARHQEALAFLIEKVNGTQEENNTINNDKHTDNKLETEPKEDIEMTEVKNNNDLEQEHNQEIINELHDFVDKNGNLTAQTFVILDDNKQPIQSLGVGVDLLGELIKKVTKTKKSKKASTDNRSHQYSDEVEYEIIGFDEAVKQEILVKNKENDGDENQKLI